MSRTTAANSGANLFSTLLGIKSGPTALRVLTAWRAFSTSLSHTRNSGGTSWGAQDGGSKGVN